MKFKLKTCIYFVLILIFCYGCKKGNITESKDMVIDPSPNLVFTEFSYANNTHVYASAFDRFWVSNDGGITWNKTIIGGEHTIECAHINDRGQGVAILDSFHNDVVYTTIDFGNTWTFRSINYRITSSFFHTAYCFDGTHLAAFSDAGDYLYTSDNNGLTWKHIIPNKNQFTFFNRGNITEEGVFATDNTRDILFSNDFMNTFKRKCNAVNIDGEKYYGTVQFADQMNGYCCDRDKLCLLTTTDGGLSWAIVKPSSKEDHIEKLAIGSGGYLFMIGYKGTSLDTYLWWSTDYGKNWKNRSIKDSYVSSKSFISAFGHTCLILDDQNKVIKFVP